MLCKHEVTGSIPVGSTKPRLRLGLVPPAEAYWGAPLARQAPPRLVDGGAPDADRAIEEKSGRPGVGPRGRATGSVAQVVRAHA